MAPIRSTRRFTAWLASLALLLGALAPAMAQGLVDARGASGWVQLCSASGMLWVQLDPADEGHGLPGDLTADGAGHCPWCKLGSAANGLPPAQALIGLLDLHQAPPATHFRSATPIAGRVSAQPRAPPSLA